MPRWAAVLPFLLAGLARPVSAAPAQADARPNVVLVVWNDAALERIGFLTSTPGGGVTPRLDGLFAEAALFPRGTLVCSRGRTTTAAILSGRHAHQTGIFSQTAGRKLEPAATLGHVFRAQGYATLHVGRFREGPAADFGFEREARGVVDGGSEAVTGFVAEHAGRRPLFVWWGPDVPDGSGAKNLDQALGALLDALDAHGARADTLFAFVPNGEPKGLEFSAKECSASRMRAPLALAGAAGRAGGRIAAGTHPELVTPLDLAPTLCDLAGLVPPPALAGRSLRPLLAGEPWEPRPVAAAFYEHQPTGSKSAQLLERNLLVLVLHEERWKYALFLEDLGVKIDKLTEIAAIERSAGEQLLVDLAADPGEEHDLSADGAQAARLDAMRATLLEWWRASGGPEFPMPALSPPLGPPPKEPRPNLVLVVADDMDYEHLGFLGNPRVRTPTLDELARTGVVFPVAHVPMSRCRPTLAALLSGRWPQETGIFENEASHTLTRRDSLPNLLKAAGYATFQGGKFWEGSHFSMGFLAPEKIDTAMERFVRQDQDELFRFIDRYHGERPLFLWWAPMLPHKPFDPPEHLRALFRDTEVPVPPFVEGDPRAFQEAERTAYAMGAWLDEGLAALRAKLEACGELDDTLFVFLIDNGWANGHPSKGTVFEKGLRTPVVVSWPKAVAGGKTRPELVCAIDLYRTLLDYAGVPAPESAGGVSLRPALEGGALETRAAIYGAVYSFRERAGPQRPEGSVYALYARTPRWKLVHYLRDVTPGAFYFHHEFAPFPARERGERALYDLEQDPYEQHDLSADPAHAELMEELFQGALAWWRATGGGELDLAADPGDTGASKKARGKKKQ